MDPARVGPAKPVVGFAGERKRGHCLKSPPGYSISLALLEGACTRHDVGLVATSTTADDRGCEVGATEARGACRQNRRTNPIDKVWLSSSTLV